MADASMADKLDDLFNTFHDPEGNEYSYRDVESGTEGAVSATTVWRLRTGQIQRPSLHVIEALAAFFGVPIAYFTAAESPSGEAARNLKLAGRLRRAMVKEAALQISDLDDPAIRDLLEIVKYIRRPSCLPRQGTHTIANTR